MPAGSLTNQGVDLSKVGQFERLPSLDGWRAMFIVLVLSSHFLPAEASGALYSPLSRFLHDGALAVRCFFVLSGFLITFLLLGEAGARGSVDVGRFYVRRVLRIFPAYFGFLAVMAIQQAVGNLYLPAVTWVALLTFTSNFFVGVDEWIVFHLWSLAIEQQFYLVWPWVFMAIQPWRRIRPALYGLLTILVAVWLFRLVAGWILFWMNLDSMRALSESSVFAQICLELRARVPWLLRGASTLNYLDTLALGCFAAVVTFHFRSTMSRMPRWLVATIFLAGSLLVAIPSMWIPEAKLLRGALFLFGFTIQGLGISLLLAISVCNPQFAIVRVLNLSPLVFLGTISYSIYIWQQPFSVLWLSSANIAYKLVAILIVASVSFFLFEKPLANLRHRLRTRS